MTRILQIRRGTTAENDNFTGLAGEITYDTTAKTLRVHDGATLGGIALARQDEIPSQSDTDFDINSVSADFWTTLFATYQTNSIQTESSGQIPVLNTTVVDHTFTCTQMPICAEVYLVCQSAEAGYSVNDEVRAFGIGNYGYPHVNTYLSNGVLHARLFVNEQAFWIHHKTDGTPTNITNANWKIKFTVYY